MNVIYQMQLQYKWQACQEKNKKNCELKNALRDGKRNYSINIHYYCKYIN